MSKPCCAIDVHTHVVPAHLPDKPEFAGLPWPSIKHTDACHAQVIISGKNFRDINDACWSVPRRTEQMPGMDVGMQVLSPMPELLSYWLPTKDSTEQSMLEFCPHVQANSRLSCQIQVSDALDGLRLKVPTSQQ